MSGAFGGSWVFNGPSPSSDAGCVARIVADYVAPIRARPRRVLDVGGTEGGFRGQAALPGDTELVIANPEAGVGAHVAYVSDIPASAPGFDFAMLFGVMMYLERALLAGLFRDIRVRLRGKATLLVAEPDYEHGFGIAEKAVQKARGLVFGKSFTFHPGEEVRRMLREAGFVDLRDRPDLRPTYPGTQIARQPAYLVIAATV
jgi:hypothetical protein